MLEAAQTDSAGLNHSGFDFNDHAIALEQCRSR